MSNWESLQHSFAPIGEGDGYFKYPTPHRYVKYFYEECQRIDMLSFLVEKCQWRPLQLKMDESYLKSLSDESEKATTLARKLLSRI